MLRIASNPWTGECSITGNCSVSIGMVRLIIRPISLVSCSRSSGWIGLLMMWKNGHRHCGITVTWRNSHSPWTMIIACRNGRSSWTMMIAWRMATALEQWWLREGWPQPLNNNDDVKDGHSPWGIIITMWKLKCRVGKLADCL